MTNLLELEENKVSVDLTQYSMIWMGDTGVGKTMSMMKFLESLVPDKKPLFLEFEDRFQNIPGIMAVRIRKMSDLKSIISQLKNPKLKEKFSCIIVDTLDKYEEFCEQYVLENRDAEILADVGGYGEGSLRFKSALRNIGTLQSLGYPVHFISQSAHSKDFDTKKESDGMKLTKNTFSYCREAAYLVGYLSKEGEDRYITFTKSEKYPHLKDTFNMPEKININNLKDTWIKAINDKNGGYVTEDKTIKEYHSTDNFEELKARGIELGGLLANNGRYADAEAVLRKNLGIDEDGNVKMFDVLRESQIELTKCIVMELEELVEKYNIK